MHAHRQCQHHQPHRGLQRSDAVIPQQEKSETTYAELTVPQPGRGDRLVERARVRADKPVGGRKKKVG